MTLGSDDFLRYSRHLLMADVGEDGQQQLLNSKVLIVGLGGLGCPVALYLAAAGVGCLNLCDPDKVDLTNLQRQILYSEKDCGQPKVTCAAERLHDLNNGVNILTTARSVDDKVLDETGQFDVVVDCSDNLQARHWLNRRCRELAVPLVSAAAMGWEGQLVTLDFSRRSSPCLACIVPEGTPEPVANCGNSGVIGPVLGVMGSMQATAVLRLLLSRDEQGSKPVATMHRFDGRRENWQRFIVTSSPVCTLCSDVDQTTETIK